MEIRTGEILIKIGEKKKMTCGAHTFFFDNLMAGVLHTPTFLVRKVLLSEGELF